MVKVTNILRKSFVQLLSGTNFVHFKSISADEIGPGS